MKTEFCIILQVGRHIRLLRREQTLAIFLQKNKNCQEITTWQFFDSGFAAMLPASSF